MAKRTPESICNIAIVGHGSTGKTTFLDNVLFTAGLTKRAGDVDAGSSLSDFDAEEKANNYSLHGTVFHFEAEGRHFNLIDCPGYLDFIGPAMAALPVVETALIAVNARDGVQLNTRRMWAESERLGLARVFMLTRVDGDNIDLETLIETIRETFGSQCQPAFLPIGLGSDCKGVANLLTTDTAPEGVEGDFDAAREALIETIIECDDSLMERYFEGDDITPAELSATLRTAVVSGTLVPILCCASKIGVGVKEVMSFLADCAPSPVTAAPRKAMLGEEEIELTADGPFCAQVFKVATDAHVGKQACFRVYGGCLEGDMTVRLSSTGKNERLGHIYQLFGADHTEVREAVMGDILAVTKVDALHVSDTMAASGKKLVMAPIAFPNPMMSLAVEATSRDDDQKMAAYLIAYAASDPTLSIHRDKQSAELVITGMSTLHLDIVLRGLKRQTDIKAVTREPSIPYRETIRGTAEAKYRHKKQTGGRGQFGDVTLRVETNEEGAGFEFLDEIVGGVIPRQFIPAVEKGIRATLDAGPLAGCPVVDVKAAAVFGSHHPVDSSEAAFKIAGGRAFRDAFMQAKPTLLEPIACMEVSIPPQFMGDISGNLSSHRAQIQGMDQVAGMTVIKASIPMAEVGRYSTELKSMTGGEGTFTLELDHYAPVPSHVRDDIIAARKKKKEQD